MEESSFQAIYTGVYIFVFIAALTTTLYMFRNVNELAENAYNYGESVTAQSVIATPTEQQYKLNADDLISYYYNYIAKDKYESSSPTEGLQNNVTIDGLEVSDIFKYVKDNKNKLFTLVVSKYEGDKITVKISVAN